MKNKKSFNMPVQGKSVPRHGTSTNYEANVEASFFGTFLSKAIPIAALIAKSLAKEI